MVSVMAETKPCATAYIKSEDGLKVYVGQCGYYRKPILFKENSASGMFQMQSREMSEGAHATSIFVLIH